VSSRGAVAVIGAGIAGLAHAWSASERGFHVTLFDRNKRADGASIRNFGMIWPIGQPAGATYDVAMRSRLRWLQLAREAAIWVNPCGSIHLAHRPDEMVVLEEFASRSRSLGYDCDLLSASSVINRSPTANPSGLLGGLFSSTELCVNPRNAVRSLPGWLTSRWNVDCRFGTPVIAIENRKVITPAGPSGPFDRIVICPGADLETLFPGAYVSSELVKCKLQMLKVGPPSPLWRQGPHLASGLTLRHYRNFEVCPGLAALRQRIAAETPELDQYGIHVMASQNELGEFILGDSHEYDAEIDPFDKQIIDDLILRELRKVVQLPDWSVLERWHGIYLKRRDGAVFCTEPQPDVHIFNGLGGSGMTMSFGLTE
jgi:FAD dependent oxidoreductase TIGR03364